ncbi:uncharacterized protein FA14DRAFT_167464 [Meira miltonrushii]|uniref:Protein-lysine N-methyltransferase EFM6 n=1 Tax=Meira miltonrushii TaxID=1280837 RepID=A0A316VC58_9BASI|nr:uncharacterized protein FA14DRAFT_167464 [Meira miltonrushii]PWN35116.1 hypothetical protein FA14DRAFT_167464 [Meira miltonrushii]
MPDANGRRSLTPDLNPFDAFIGQGDDQSDVGEQDGLQRNGLVPQQLPSIIDERAIVRYYKDPYKTPIIISSGHQEQARQGTWEDFFDVALALDVTTGCGGKIWPAAEVLGQYIASKRTGGEWKGKQAVELGAGTGLVGLLAAQLGDLEKVWITDQIPMMKLMAQNLDLNPDLRERCIVAELNWGEAVPEDVTTHPDVLLLADCVYLEIAFQPLVDTMVEMSTPQTEILFCYQQRRKADKRFFKMLRKHFTFTDIEDDDPERAKQYNRQGTHLYRVQKK